MALGPPHCPLGIYRHPRTARDISSKLFLCHLPWSTETSSRQWWGNALLGARQLSGERQMLWQWSVRSARLRACQWPDFYEVVTSWHRGHCGFGFISVIFYWDWVCTVKEWFKSSLSFTHLLPWVTIAKTHILWLIKVTEAEPHKQHFSFTQHCTEFTPAYFCDNGLHTFQRKLTCRVMRFFFPGV